MGCTFFQTQIKEHLFLRCVSLLPLAFFVDTKQASDVAFIARGDLMSSANNVYRPDQNIAQKRFAPLVREIFDVFLQSLDNLTIELLHGDHIGSFNITDIMREGAWVDRNVLSRITTFQK